jgi:hypothetical protein
MLLTNMVIDFYNTNKRTHINLDINLETYVIILSFLKHRIFKYWIFHKKPNALPFSIHLSMFEINAVIQIFEYR